MVFIDGIIDDPLDKNYNRVSHFYLLILSTFGDIACEKLLYLT